MPNPPKDFEIDWNKLPTTALEPAQPSPCDPEIFKYGDVICSIGAGPRSFTIEEWIKKVRAKCGERVDWCFAGGVAQIMCLNGHDKVAAAICELEDELIAAYMTCEHNITEDAPRRQDVRIYWSDL